MDSIAALLNYYNFDTTKNPTAVAVAPIVEVGSNKINLVFDYNKGLVIDPYTKAMAEMNTKFISRKVNERWGHIKRYIRGESLQDDVLRKLNIEDKGGDARKFMYARNVRNLHKLKKTYGREDGVGDEFRKILRLIVDSDDALHEASSQAKLPTSGTIHAEAAVANFLRANQGAYRPITFGGNPVPLGVSKLSCGFCSSYIKGTSLPDGLTIDVRGASGQSFNGWVHPETGDVMREKCRQSESSQFRWKYASSSESDSE
ncbi:hypothetical protein WKR88_18275 [Trinickia caryophylli]|nr:hypothetical protein [Trinickia caryophylli]WQE12194.1 hypothetical protein U0034_01840 [Trinickia caryophylli]GLU31671.1 hypothetical protein Busp01_15130 [Trinickia caryophylli]